MNEKEKFLKEWEKVKEIALKKIEEGWKLDDLIYRDDHIKVEFIKTPQKNPIEEIHYSYIYIPRETKEGVSEDE